MKIIRTFTPAALVVALSLAALPAAAQGRARDDRGRPAREVGRAAARDGGPRQNGSREAAPRQDSRYAGPRDYGRAQAVPRQMAPRQNYRYEPRRDMGRAYVEHRGYVAPRGYAHGGYVAPRSYMAPRGYRAYGIAPYRPYYFERPYYTFRPRHSIGFGLWLGFGVPYPRAWVSYPPPVYGYYQGGVRVVPGAAAYGGVSFDISPRDAAIILDGTYIGYAGDFAPNAAPLTLTAGPHRIEVQADGYQPMSWDVDIVPGQVLPFRGDMQPY
jgi:hypothetical protein